MKLLTSYSCYDNNASFGFKVPKTSNGKEVQFEDLFLNRSLVAQEYKFAACSAYTRFSNYTQKLFFQVPINYFHPKYRSEEAFKAWEEEMKLMGGNVKFLGIYKWAGTNFSSRHTDNVAGFNEHVLKAHRNNPYIPSNLFIKQDLWATFELDVTEYRTMLQTYHSFCLFRYLWSWHYHKIVDIYYDIKKRLSKTKPHPIEILQLAHYSFDPAEVDKTSESTRYNGSYCHVALEDFALKIKKFDQLMEALANTTNASLNIVFTGSTIRHTYNEILSHIKERKYKAAYDKLKA